MHESRHEETRHTHSGDLLDEGTDPLPKVIKHYKVVREIGTGGMGRVLKCLDTTLNRYVAVKMLKPALTAESGFIERFRREALAVAKTRHPNIVHIYSIDEDDGRAFYTMEYVEGEGLEKMLERRGPLGEKEAVEIVRQAAEGLAHVHRTGILHRDVKPSNFLLDSSSRVLLTDFGLAKMEFQQILKSGPGISTDSAARKRDLGETDPGRVMGTPYYMSPECILGRAPDVRSDIYSLGIVFYEMLTNRVPFDGESASEIFQSHLNDIPVPVGEVAPETSLSVANIIYKCIEKEPASRYENCRELLDDLNKVVAGWHMEKEIEEKKRLSMEIAKAMRMETRPGTQRMRGRLIGMAVLLLVLVGFILLISEAFQDISSVPLPSGTPEWDRNWVANKPARIFGLVEAVHDDEDPVRVRVRSIWEEGQPSVSAVIPVKLWKEDLASERPSPNDTLFFEGRVEEADGLLRIRVPSAQYIREPDPLHLETREDRTFKPVDWDSFVELEEGAQVLVRGSILRRDEDGYNLLLGEKLERVVEVRLEIVSLASQTRIGENIFIKGVIAKADGPENRPIVEKAYIQRTPRNPTE